MVNSVYLAEVPCQPVEGKDLAWHKGDVLGRHPVVLAPFFCINWKHGHEENFRRRV